MGSKITERIKRWSLFAVVVLGFISCDQVQNIPFLNKGKGDELNDKNKFVVSAVDFSEDYKEMRVSAHLREDVEMSLMQNNIGIDSIVAYEADLKGVPFSKKLQPQLVSITNDVNEEISELNHKTLILVDLTLADEEIEKEREAVLRMKALYSNESNFYISFMYDGMVTESVLVTDYVIENYFKQRNGVKLLYRSILDKLEEMSEGVIRFSHNANPKIWEGLRSEQKMLIILSDGKVYESNGRPIDEDHYLLQQELMGIHLNRGYASLPVVCYVDIATALGLGQDYASDAKARLELLCRATKGIYFEEFNMTSLAKRIIEGMGIPLYSYQFVFNNPDGKTYKGEHVSLHVDAYCGDSVFATGERDYSVGSVYKPIIVNGDGLTKVIVKGVFYALIVLLLAYLILQLLYPYISYRIFEKKYVLTYTGAEKGVEGNMVTKTCYYCKGEFQVGDKIVAKCPHTVHLSCWEENGYMCPEHGPHCKKGSHFYNKYNLFDFRNASMYLRWVFCGILAALCGWIAFTLSPLKENGILTYAISVFSGKDGLDANYYKDLGNAVTNILNLPYYGLSISFFLSLFLSTLTDRGRWLWRRLSILGIRTLIGGVIGYFTFIIGGLLYILFGVKGSNILIDALCWGTIGVGIAFSIAYKSREIDSKRIFRGAVCSAALGLLSMYLWSLLLSARMDTREFGVFSYLLYSVGLAVTIAFALPKSSRYFLHVEGPIKTMDLALFKWMNVSTTEKTMTIGMSVSCDLQMAWDMRGNIEPMHAEIQKIKDDIYLIPLADVKADGKILHEGKRMKLKHGVSFFIGETKFTYLEKDL